MTTAPVHPAAGDGPIPAPAVAPGRRSLGPTIAAFDRRVDAAFERVRGHRVTDAIFVEASRLGDFSVIWHLANATRGLTSERRTNQVPALAAALGVESLLVNQGFKRIFRRPRPTVQGDPRYPVRRPSTSAFPSGHASAAAFTATVLTAWDGPRSAPLWWAIAATVATSRAYVRIHHPSDVVAGMATGAALGVGAVAAMRRLGIR